MTYSYLIHGDNRQSLALLEDESVDAVVTDPPYGLGKEPDMVEVLKHWLAGDDYTATGGGFMGKTWDSFVPGPATWREVYRVLKPGGHVLAFGGTRTFDMSTLALRLAGFEIRDVLSWNYGSGFPKSMDISKAIDKAAGATREVVGPNRFGSKSYGSDFGIVNDDNWSPGERPNGRDLTAPATDAAKQWEGWGTALKPAWESVVWATKMGNAATVDRNLSKLEESLWSLALANGAEAPSMSNPVVTAEGAFDGVRWNAGMSPAQVASRVLMGTSWSEAEMMMGTSSTSWNIVRSWRIILAEISELMNTSTMATSVVETIDWTTLSRWTLEITPESIIRDEIHQGGQASPVCGVIDHFNVVFQKLNAIRTLSAPASVIDLDHTPCPGEGGVRPEFQPIVLARKPFKGTVAANVQAHGTGALNIDATRIGTEERFNAAAGNKPGGNSLMMSAVGMPEDAEGRTAVGRWPANVLLTHHEDCVEVGSKQIQSNGHFPSQRPSTTTITTEGHGGQVDLPESYTKGETVEVWECVEACPVRLLDAQTGIQKSGVAVKRNLPEGGADQQIDFKARSQRKDDEGYGDTGGASRFFANLRPDHDMVVAWKQSDAKDAESHSSPSPRSHDSDSVASSVQGELTTQSVQPVSVEMAPSTSATESASSVSVESVMPVIPSIDSRFSPELQLVSDFPSNSHASHVEASGQTDITTTTPSPSSSAGYAEDATSQSMSSNEGPGGLDSPDAVRFKYNGKVPKRERNAGLPEGMVNDHPTTKPIAVMEWLIKLVTPPGGWVVDPFNGSGATGIAAAKLGFNYIGFELSDHFIDISEHRIRHAGVEPERREGTGGIA